MTKFLRGGVIGAGVFGGHHARQYARLPGTVLSAVLDPHADRAAALAVPLGGRAFVDMTAFLEAVDVVTIASPAGVHADQAIAALQAGKPVYVEKPVATAAADAEALAAVARQTGLVVACGHQERALFQVIGLFDVPEPPLALEAVRHGTPSQRSLDVSVVLDLMVHDLDLALALSPAGPTTVRGQGVQSEDGGWAEARAEAVFSDGFTARFDVSRQAAQRRRTMRIVYPSGEVEIDFLSRAFRNSTPYALNADFADTPAAQDTLAASITAFLQAVRGERPEPLVGVDQAARALDLALRVEGALHS
jgi:predicted dehydrogenase